MPVQTGSRSIPLTTTRHGYGTGSTPTSRDELAYEKDKILTRFTMNRVSTNTPGFGKYVGRLPANPYTYEETTYTYESGYLHSWTPKLKYPQYGAVDYTVVGVNIESVNWQASDVPQNVSASDLSLIDQRAKTKMLQKLKNQKFNLAVATAEAGKTMQMVGDTAIKIASAIHDMRSGDIVGAAAHLGIVPSRRVRRSFRKTWPKDRAKALAGGWLEIQYGWKPLLQDVHGACEELASRHEEGVYTTVRTRQSIDREYNYYSRKASPSVLQTGSARTEVAYSITFARYLDARQDLPRLGITNPLEVAWELVPYSFVVDWFLPIGSWLGTLDATLGLSFISGYKTTYQKLDVKQQRTYSPDLTQSQTSDGYWLSSIHQVRVYRTILTDFPSPGYPRFKNPLSFDHMKNGLALLTNLVTRK